MEHKKRVIFGNPSLGTYNGYVHLYPHTEDDASNDKAQKQGAKHEDDDDEYSCMVAVCGVPPEQVPEGVLDFARSFRSSMTHVRAVISVDHDDRKGTCTGAHEQNDQASHNFTNTVDAEEGTTRTEDVNNDNTREKKFLVLVSLRNSNAAKSFVTNLNGKPFNIFEKDVLASVYHVSRLESDEKASTRTQGGSKDHCTRIDQNCCDDDFGMMNNPLFPGVGVNQLTTAADSKKIVSHSQSRKTNEISNCPVCLEPMSPPSSPKKRRGVVSREKERTLFTTVCNHTFHMECLLRCEDAPCPVCRFDHAGVNEMQVKCHICGTADGIYVCLICGVASCFKNEQTPSGDNEKPRHKSAHLPARPGKRNDKGNIESYGCAGNISSGGHARQHYDETLHAYALDTETQHVWDFAGQGFVHRLIQNEDDGKIVEIPDPTNTMSEERSLIPSLTDAEEDEVVHRKLEGYANEYHHLLQNQLEQQRLYFQGILRDIRRDHEENISKTNPSDLISALKQDLNQLQQRQHSLRQKSSKVAESVAFMQNMNESLEANKEPMKKKISNMQKQRKEYQNMLERSIPPLEKRVQRLMMELESGG